MSGDPYRFANRSTVLRCRHCQHNSSLTAGTVMERTHSPLSLEAGLRDGLKSRQFIVHYQPQVTPAATSPAAETLVR